jgi:hypothetical protein
MRQQTEWPEPSLAETRNGGENGGGNGGSRQPDTETLLAELGAFYPVVTYPTAQEEPKHEEQLDQVIFAGLVWP